MGYDRDLIDILYRELYTFHQHLPWVCLHDITIEEFQRMHHNVINTELPAIIKGHYLIMHYYNNVWNSRGESSKLADFLNINNAYEFYCGSNGYQHINAEQLLILHEANYKDQSKMKRMMIDECDIKCLKDDKS